MSSNVSNGLGRSASGSLLSSGLQRSLPKDTPSRKKLIDQGLHSLIDNIVTDLKAAQLAKQLQALKALQGLAQSRGSSEAVQTTFREAGGLPLLIHIVDASNTGSEPADKQRELNAAATESLFFLIRNSTESREIAVKAGAVAALAGNLGAGASLPTSMFVLRSLHSLISPDPSGQATTELFACGGIHALVKLLGMLVDAAEDLEGREAWVQETLALLEPAAGRSRLVAHMMASHAAIFCRLLTASAEPLSLSLSLDILEEALVNGEGRRTAVKLAGQGAVAALLHATCLKGFGARAANVLTRLVEEDPQLMSLLRYLLQPQDMAALVRTAARSAKAEDVEAAAPMRLLGELIQEQPASNGHEASGSVPHMLRSVVLSCCVGACLRTEATCQPVLRAAASPLGSLLLLNLSSRNSTEAAIAAAQLLPHRLPAAAQILRRAEAVPALVAAFLEEHSHADLDPLAGLEATDGIVNMLRIFPEEAETPLSSEATSLQLEARLPNGNAGENNDPSYGSITFHVAGHEFVALSWVMQRASPAIARTLAAISDTSSAAVIIPDVPGILPERLYRLFGVAVEFAQSGSLATDDSDALDLWAVAAVLQMEGLAQQCELLLETRLLQVPSHLQRALQLAAQFPAPGEALCRLCCRHLAQHLEDGDSSAAAEQLAPLASAHREVLQHGFEVLLKERLSRQKLEEAGSLQSELLLEASRLPPDAQPVIAPTSSFGEWMKIAAPRAEGDSARLIKSASIEFPTNGSISEIKPDL